MLARLLAIVMTAAFLAGCDINAVPRLDEEVKASWSQVQNQYQRRADLIPNLVETVKGYAAHERETLEAVIQARAKATSMQLPADITQDPAAFQQFQQNQAELSSALARLMVVVEQYPNLKADQQFLALQSQLEGTENRIAVARKDYIGAVQTYNTEIRTIPGRWIAAVMYPEAKVKETFTAAEPAQQAPTVKF
ncbi:MAG: LemA family protein [Rhodospirillaceae bacterium]